MEDLVSPYTSFAAAYDTMMANVDYVRWANYVQKLFAHYNVRPKRILDMACGTGSTAMLLAEKGYEMSGSDRAHHLHSFVPRASRTSLSMAMRVSSSMGRR